MTHGSLVQKCSVVPGELQSKFTSEKPGDGYVMHT